MEVRRVLTQSAWTYRFPARVTADFEKQNFDADKKVRELAWRAQVRLCGRYRKLSARGKRAQVVCMAVAREASDLANSMPALGSEEMGYPGCEPR